MLNSNLTFILAGLCLPMSVEYELKYNTYAFRVERGSESDQKLVESGFEYVTEIDGVKLFRKRK
jgi:hypothetical protein